MLLTADPKSDYLAHADAIHAAIERVLASGVYILGPEVAAFEAEFAAYQGGGYTLGVANGTEGIELALRALGVTRGDRVATVANTVTATVSAIEQIGAVPVFVEIDPVTLLMDPSALESVLAREGGAVRAVVAVHLYGHPAPMPELIACARRHGAWVVEDCAQAHGARLQGRRAGTWGDAAAFSFYPTKNLGAIGDGGAVHTGDAAVADRVRHSRLDELQAAILRAKLPHLDAGNARRRAIAARYDTALADLPMVRPPLGSAQVEPVFHQYVVRTPQREALRTAMQAQSILCGVLYPTPVHRQPAYANAASTSLPLSERACSEVLCLPCHPGLTDSGVDEVVAAVRSFFR